MGRKERPRLIKSRPLRSFLTERSTLIIERPLLGSRKASSVKEKPSETKRYQPRKAKPSKPVSRFVPRVTPKSELDYCVECAIKHSQTAKILMREALQRAQAGSPSDWGVQEKVRGVVEELVGLEDDTDTTKNERVAELNNVTRILRKFIYTTKAEVGGASLDQLREIKDMVDKLVDAAYKVRMREECVGCSVEELCRGNLECVEFMEKAAKAVKSPEEFKKILNEARTSISD